MFVSFSSKREARPSTLQTEYVFFRYSRNLSKGNVVSYTIHCTVLVKDGEINGTVDQDKLICDVDLTCQAQVPASNKAISNHLRGRGGHRKGLNARVCSYCTSLDDSVTGLILDIGHWLLVRGYHDRRGDGDAKRFRHHLEFPLLLFLTEPKFSTAPIVSPLRARLQIQHQCGVAMQQKLRFFQPSLADWPEDMALSSDSSSYHFQTLLDAALRDYEKQTGTKLADDPLAHQLETCDSVESVTAVLQKQAPSSNKFRGNDSRAMKSLKRGVHVLYMLSASTLLGEGVGVVRRTDARL